MFIRFYALASFLLVLQKLEVQHFPLLKVLKNGRTNLTRLQLVRNFLANQVYFLVFLALRTNQNKIIFFMISYDLIKFHL